MNTFLQNVRELLNSIKPKDGEDAQLAHMLSSAYDRLEKAIEELESFGRGHNYNDPDLNRYTSKYWFQDNWQELDHNDTINKNIIVKELIDKYSDDSLSRKPGMVYQVWEDGEITLQKSGELLWQRGLHSIHAGNPKKSVDITLFPHIDSTDHAYAFVTEEGAKAIRKAILNEEEL